MVKRVASSPLPAAGEGKRGETGYLGYLLRQGAHAYRLQIDQALSDLGLTQPQFTVMTMLAAYPGHSNADLARLALLTPQTMSVIVGNLRKAGLVGRQAHSRHGRIQTLDLTEDGRRLLTAAKSRVYGLESGLQASLSEEEAQVVRRWLVQVAAQAEMSGISDYIVSE